MDSGFHTVDSRFQVLDSWFYVSRTKILPDSLSVELNCILFRIPIVNGTPDSKAQDFGFLKQTYFLRFRNPDYLSWSEVFFTNAIISIFFKFYTDCVYGWAKLIKSANLMLNWFLLFSVSRWWHLVYMKSMLHQFYFPWNYISVNFYWSDNIISSWSRASQQY